MHPSEHESPKDAGVEDRVSIPLVRIHPSIFPLTAPERSAKKWNRTTFHCFFFPPFGLPPPPHVSVTNSAKEQASPGSSTLLPTSKSKTTVSCFAGSDKSTVLPGFLVRMGSSLGHCKEMKLWQLVPCVPAPAAPWVRSGEGWQRKKARKEEGAGISEEDNGFSLA